MSRRIATDAVVRLTEALIRCPSVTPADAGCQALLGERLQASGFTLEDLSAGEVSNLWATHGGGAPLVVLAGHTDVVPPGPLTDWNTDPFEPMHADGLLYGRGAADMKASLAAMVIAAETLVAARPDHAGTLALLLTSDEEGPAIDGTRAVVAALTARGIRPDYCVVGEPSSSRRLGDVVRNGRRGSLNGELIVHGQQGHVAYPADADNPIHKILPALTALATRRWDEGNAYFPPTSFQIANLNAGTGATNVIPGTLTVGFNFRYCTEQTSTGLQQAVMDTLREQGLQPERDYTLNWALSGEPFLTPAGRLTEVVTAAIAGETGAPPALSTGGGTSDGRFIAPTGCQVVELGPVNATIHKVNEQVAIADLAPLARMYHRIIDDLLTDEACAV